MPGAAPKIRYYGLDCLQLKKFKLLIGNDLV